MLHSLVLFWFGLVKTWGYGGVVLLMALESSIFPVPSEIVVPPAAFWAAQGRMSFWGVVIAGTFGSWLGATATYWAARWLGPPLVERWGRCIGCGPDKVARGHRLLARYAAAGVFFSRLLPVVRHVIGIPAGILRVPFLTYSLATVAGSFVWCSVLAWFGWDLARSHPGAIDDPQVFQEAFAQQSWKVVLACLVLASLYILMLRLTARPVPATEIKA